MVFFFFLGGGGSGAAHHPAFYQAVVRALRRTAPEHLWAALLATDSHSRRVGAIAAGRWAVAATEIPAASDSARRTIGLDLVAIPSLNSMDGDPSPPGHDENRYVMPVLVALRQQLEGPGPSTEACAIAEMLLSYGSGDVFEEPRGSAPRDAGASEAALETLRRDVRERRIVLATDAGLLEAALVSGIPIGITARSERSRARENTVPGVPDLDVRVEARLVGSRLQIRFENRSERPVIVNEPAFGYPVLARERHAGAVPGAAMRSRLLVIFGQTPAGFAVDYARCPVVLSGGSWSREVDLGVRPDPGSSVCVRLLRPRAFGGGDGAFVVDSIEDMVVEAPLGAR